VDCTGRKRLVEMRRIEWDSRVECEEGEMGQKSACGESTRSGWNLRFFHRKSCIDASS